MSEENKTAQVVLPSGKVANVNGDELEVFVEAILLRKGYQFIQRNKFSPAIYLEQPIYSRQVDIGESIYQTKLYCDFHIYHPQKWPQGLIIESKWQQSVGSVDEKYPFLVLNIKQKYPAKTIVLLDGGGYKRQAAEWLKAQTDNKLLKVMSMSEFQIWANKNNF
jgi:hypothetical protein